VSQHHALIHHVLFELDAVQPRLQSTESLPFRQASVGHDGVAIEQGLSNPRGGGGLDHVDGTLPCCSPEGEVTGKRCVDVQRKVPLPSVVEESHLSRRCWGWLGQRAVQPRHTLDDLPRGGQPAQAGGDPSAVQVGQQQCEAPIDAIPVVPGSRALPRAREMGETRRGEVRVREHRVEHTVLMHHPHHPRSMVASEQTLQFVPHTFHGDHGKAV